MMNFLRKYQYHIFIVTMVTFLGGTFIGFGGYFFSSKTAPSDPIAEVNGENIPIRIFQARYQQAVDQVKPPATLDENGRKQKQEEAVRDLIQSVAFSQESKRYGIEVPDQQVAISLSQVPAFQEKGAFSPRLYVQALRSQVHLTPQEFEEEQRRSVEFFKLRWLVQSVIKVTDRELQMDYAYLIYTTQNKLGEALKQFGPKSEQVKQAREDLQQLRKGPESVRDRLTQEKTLWSFNQWFNQIAQHTKIKTHMDRVEGLK